MEPDPNGKEDLLAFFDSCLLPRDEKELIARLKNTAAVRFRDLADEKVLMERSFHLYLTFPKLVYYEKYNINFHFF